MSITRRGLIVAGGAALAGCSRPRKWNGFAYYTAGPMTGKPLVVAPVGPDGLAQWIPQAAISAFVSSGFYVVGANWRGMDGGEEDYGARYTLIREWLTFLGIKRTSLYAQSRGGLQLLNFACDHPDSVDRIVALYPVTDPYIYPGNGRRLWNAYRIRQNTLNRPHYTPNLKAHKLLGKPVKIWHGDNDLLVPKDETTDRFAPACGAQVVTLRGMGHVKFWTPEIADFLTV